MDLIFGRENFRNEVIWCYAGGGTPSQDFPRKHDVILRYTKSKNCTFNVLRKPYGEHSKSGRRATDLGGTRSLEYNPEGTPINDWWVDIKPLINWNKERLGYPTQKPVSLLERIINTSSNENDIVLDPYCGCGTTVHAAEKLGRQWIGIDISQFATGLIRNRLVQHFKDLTISNVFINGVPSDIKLARALAKRNPFEFEKWVCGEIGAEGMYHAPGSRGADGGVDGIIRFYHTDKWGSEDPKVAMCIVQVKGGSVAPNDVKALAETVRQHQRSGANALCGVFVCFEKYMNTVYNQRDPSKVKDLVKDFDFIQPISIEEMMNGKRPHLPGWQQARQVA